MEQHSQPNFSSGFVDEIIAKWQEPIKGSPNSYRLYQTMSAVYEIKGGFLQTTTHPKKVVGLVSKPSPSLISFPYDYQTVPDMLSFNNILLGEFVRPVEHVIHSLDDAKFDNFHFELGMADRINGLSFDARTEFRQVILINPDFNLACHYFWHFEEECRKVAQLS